MAYLVNTYASAHGTEDATDIMFTELIGVQCTGEVADPQTREDFIHCMTTHAGCPPSRNEEAEVEVMESGKDEG